MRELPQWMEDCIDHHEQTEGRLPTFWDFMAWKDAEASCRMEHE